ncbi:serine/threonine-protein kinase [Streptomyces sp. NPDC005374]|uniref:serine/threonine-protein kinase n=1 Tax=Streptomyces sp. NPDC005374 TaxID=3364713 RepID=UPI003677647C
MSEDGEHSPDVRLIGGRYRLTGRIGSGPNGTVWRAFDEQDERYVAVKEPHLSGDAEDEERRRAAHRLPHEARAAARVDHPAAVAIHDVLLDGELPWIIMELVEGESLRTALAARGPLPAPEAARIALAVLGALHAAHRVGIVHRDVKPSNVLLEAGSGRVVVTDFGTGAAGRSDAEDASVAFVAPECVSGRGAGPASDVWSLGALLRSAVAGGEAGPLGPLLARLLAPEPEARPTAEEAAEVLAEVAGVGLPEWAAEPAASPAAVEGGAVLEGGVAVEGGAVLEREAPAPALSPAEAPDPAAAPHEPRRLTALAALGLLLQKKPERG